MHTDIKITGHDGVLPVWITLRLDARLPTRVEVDLSSAEGSHAMVVFPFAVGDEDVQRFVGELRQLHETLEGDAALGEYVGSCLRVRSTGHGKLAIDYTWRPVSPDLSAEFTLKGLTSDQSYLPDMIRRFEDLLV